MSAYQRFIDSAASPQKQRTRFFSVANLNQTQQQQTNSLERDQEESSSLQVNKFKSTMMIQHKQHPISSSANMNRISTIGQSLDSFALAQRATIAQQQTQVNHQHQKKEAAGILPATGMSSTPISKQQYRLMVEAEHKIKRQQQAQKQQENHYCSSSASCCHHLRHEQQVTCSSRQNSRFSSQLYHQQPSSCLGSDTTTMNTPNGRPQEQEKQKQHQIDAFFKTDDPILLKWLQAMRFETELECLTSLQARTLAIDEYSAGALSIRNSQVSIQETRLESNFLLDYIDYLIESLPLKFQSVGKFYIEFSELWTRLTSQTTAQTATGTNYHQQPVVCANNQQLNQQQSTQSHLTIINCTPRKSQAGVRSMRPLDKLAIQIRNLCSELANILFEYQEDCTGNGNCNLNSSLSIDNDQLESSLRRLKELYGKFVEIFIRAECANIVRALNYDFSQSSLNRLSSSSSLRPARPFESSSAQLPLKWALIALWQLTKGDSYICRTLTEKWQTTESSSSQQVANSSPVAKRLDYSTKYDQQQQTSFKQVSCENQQQQDDHSLRSDYQKLFQICRQQHYNGNSNNRENDENCATTATMGALNSALNSREQPIKQVSTIELLIEIIISQPNKHERLDMMNYIHTQARHDKLIDLDEWDQSVSAAIYTSNQYKVAALRILNHLCVNEQAVKTILRCFSTPPPARGQPIPENKIIRSIFECYQTSQDHIYQNETMFRTGISATSRQRKKLCTTKQTQVGDDQLDEECSDYGSRQTCTNSQATTCTNSASSSDHSTTGNQDNQLGCEDDGDDVVVKEAIRLLVQLTTSFHRSNQGLDFYTLIGRFSIDSLVKYLTNIIKSTASREMLFLSLTALANISFITTEPMRLYGTNRCMLEMFRASKSRSKDLELRDQAVTILANTADKNLLDIVSNAGLTFLLSCLESCPTRMANYRQLDRLRNNKDNGSSGSSSNDDYQRLNIENKPRDRKPIDFSEDFPDILDCACDQQQQQPQPTPTESIYGNTIRFDPSSTTPVAGGSMQAPSLCLSRLSPNDLAAMERIHQKTAVAFARMSVDPSTTRMVLKYGGIKQMIDLCKFSHKRNHSDTVLIACIAALRKMAKVIESETFRYYNALDLIELELNQALEIYGTPKEHSASYYQPTHHHNNLSPRHPRLFASDV